MMGSAGAGAGEAHDAALLLRVRVLLAGVFGTDLGADLGVVDDLATDLGVPAASMPTGTSTGVTVKTSPPNSTLAADAALLRRFLAAGDCTGVATSSAALVRGCDERPGVLKVTSSSSSRLSTSLVDRALLRRFLGVGVGAAASALASAAAGMEARGLRPDDVRLFGVETAATAQTVSSGACTEALDLRADFLELAGFAGAGDASAMGSTGSSAGALTEPRGLRADFLALPGFALSVTFRVLRRYVPGLAASQCSSSGAGAAAFFPFLPILAGAGAAAGAAATRGNSWAMMTSFFWFALTPCVLASACSSLRGSAASSTPDVISSVAYVPRLAPISAPLRACLNSNLPRLHPFLAFAPRAKKEWRQVSAIATTPPSLFASTRGRLREPPRR